MSNIIYFKGSCLVPNLLYVRLRGVSAVLLNITLNHYPKYLNMHICLFQIKATVVR
jgi:hypothetical protein